MYFRRPIAGTTELAAADWLDGQGADVISNGDNAANNAGNSCVAHAGAPGGSGCPSNTVFAGEETNYPQNGVAVVPTDWEATLTVGADQSCS